MPQVIRPRERRDPSGAEANRKTLHGASGKERLAKAMRIVVTHVEYSRLQNVKEVHF